MNFCLKKAAEQAGEAGSTAAGADGTQQEHQQGPEQTAIVSTVSEAAAATKATMPTMPDMASTSAGATLPGKLAGASLATARPGAGSGKSLQNSFQNNMRSSKCPDWLTSAWEDLKKLPQKDPTRVEFVHQVASVTNKAFEDNDYLKSNFFVKQTLQTTTSEGSKGGWYSYDWVVNKEGKMVTDEMIRLGTLPTRLHSGLIEGQHNVPWPHCLECKWSKEVFSKSTSASTSAETQLHGEASAQMRSVLAERVADAMNGVSSTSQPSAAMQVAAPPAPPPVDATKAAAAFKNAARAHSEWDRAKRLFGGTLVLAMKNIHTKDTTMLVELKDIVEKGTQHDTELCAWETKQRSGDVLGGDALEKVKELCDAIFNLKKEGNTRNTLLMTWIKMKV